MLITDFKRIGSVYNGQFSIKEIRYGQQLVWRKGSGFTSKYNREVEYLLAKDSNTYIITPLKFIDLTKYNFEIKGWCGLGATMLFGSRDGAISTDSNQVALIHSSNGQYQYRIMSGAVAGSLSANNTNPHVFKWIGADKAFFINDTAVTISSTAKSNAPKINSQYELALFGCNSGGFVDNVGKDRCIYYFKVWYEGELILDYIPVVDNNGIACFYDTVTDSLIKCSGTGKFEFAEKEQNDTRKI